MSLSEYLAPDRVVLLEGSTKAEAIEQLADVLMNAGLGVPREKFVEAIWERERLMSTGIGNGLGIPHVRLPDVAEPLAALGINRDGLTDYHSLDGEPIHIVLMIAAPDSRPEVYILLLASISGALKEEDVRRAVINCKDPEEIYRLLTDGRG